MAEGSPNPLSSSTASPCADNRRSPRFEADCFVAIQLNHRRFIATCLDYNEHGFGALVEDEQLPVGEILAVELPIAGGVPLKLQAKVIYHEGQRHGFEFVAPEDSKRRLVADFFRESAGARPRTEACRSVFGHVIRAGACIFCDWQPETPEESK
jgi:hypothetical protein